LLALPLLALAFELLLAQLLRIDAIRLRERPG
jgi:hypothetical protein